MEGKFLNNLFLEMMRWVYDLTAHLSATGFGSVVLTIIICTIVLRCLTIFSDIKTRKSSADMAKLQPEIQKIQKKYANDPRKAQTEQSKLMKERGVSMWGSCLPLLITMPLFFCFFAAFRYWGYEMTLRLLVEENAMELFESFKFLWINNIWQPDNGLQPDVASAASILSTPDISKLLYLNNTPGVWDKLVDVGIALKQISGGIESYKIINTEAAVAAYNTAVQPFIDVYAGHNNGWFLMSVLAGGSNFLSAWLMQRNQPKAEGQAAQSGKWMTYLFPILSFFYCLSYNAAFAVYWTISSVLMIVINLILDKKFPRQGAVAEVEDK